MPRVRTDQRRISQLEGNSQRARMFHRSEASRNSIYREAIRDQSRDSGSEPTSDSSLGIVEYGSNPVFSPEREDYEYFDERGRPMAIPIDGTYYNKEGTEMWRSRTRSPSTLRIHDEDSDSPPNELVAPSQKFGKMGWKMRKGNAMSQISSTISKDNTAGECVRNAKLLADFAKKHQRFAFGRDQEPENFEDTRNPFEFAEQVRNVGVDSGTDAKDLDSPKRIQYFPGGPGGGRYIDENGTEISVDDAKNNYLVRSPRRRESDDLSRRAEQPNGQAFNDRYDFGKSLSKAIEAANSSLGDPNGLSMSGRSGGWNTARNISFGRPPRNRSRSISPPRNVDAMVRNLSALEIGTRVSKKFVITNNKARLSPKEEN